MKFFSAFVVVVAFAALVHAAPIVRKGIPDEQWGYVDVRDKAHMFWLLYGAQVQERSSAPLILWLQGGPGGSSVGFGNFGEIGPLNVAQQPRNTTWLQTANLLFIDQPVGTGFSYVDSSDAYTKNEDEIAADVLVLLQSFFQNFPDLSGSPFWIFCESYGGKMTASIGAAVYDAVQAGKLSTNFKGVALGDSWISPLDCVAGYGSFLKNIGQVDPTEAAELDKSAATMAKLVNESKFTEAAAEWSAQQSIMEMYSGGVNVYNFLMHGGVAAADPYYMTKPLNSQFGDQDLDKLMNGPIKKKFGIPSHVKWGGQSSEVFEHLSEDFMQDVIFRVDELLNKGVSVAVYNGELDVIVETPSVVAWMAKLKWDGMDKFYKASRDAQFSNPKTRETQAFKQQYKNLQFWEVMNAGHMVPADNGDMALKMMQTIVGA